MKIYFHEFCKKGGSIAAQSNLLPLSTLAFKRAQKKGKTTLAINAVRYFWKMIEHGNPIPRLYIAARKT